MWNHRLNHGRHDFFANFGRSRKEKGTERFYWAHSSTSSLSWSKFSITKSARCTTGSRRMNPVKAAKPSTTCLISQSVIPSPTASIGPLRPMSRTVIRFPSCRDMGLRGPILAVGDGMTDCEIRQVVEGFAAFTGFMRREPVVQRADFVIENFDQLRELVLE